MSLCAADRANRYVLIHCVYKEGGLPPHSSSACYFCFCVSVQIMECIIKLSLTAYNTAAIKKHALNECGGVDISLFKRCYDTMVGFY